MENRFLFHPLEDAPESECHYSERNAVSNAENKDMAREKFITEEVQGRAKEAYEDLKSHGWKYV